MQDHSKIKDLNRRLCRTGISLFEVLVAMLIASIGVFGVIVLIPFAWETAERGIDRENAINAANNFFSDMQAYGYHRPDQWYNDVPTAQRESVATNPANQDQPTVAQLVNEGFQNNSNIIAGWPYVIDPIGADQSLVAGMTYGQFPFSTPFSTDGFLPRINVATFLGGFDVTGVPFGLNRELSRRIALQQDDLVFQDPLDELGPPRQAYLSVNGIPTVKRQSDGRYAALSFVVPEDDEMRQYRLFTLVGKAGERDTERIFQLNPPPNGGGPNRGFLGTLLGGGDVVLNEDPATANQLDQADLPIRNGDFVMLINYHRTDLNSDPDQDPLHDDIQLNFYRVLNSVQTDALQHSVTLQGPDFDVFRDWDEMAAAGSQVTNTVTYAVLIPNVLAVYERTFRTEEVSTWTNQ